MSLYNMMMSTNPAAPYCLAMLGLVPPMIGRFRDAWFSDDGKTITILTRMGGGNREAYPDEIEALRTVPGYLGDSDDDYDCTYARFQYAVPEAEQHGAALMAELMKLAGKGEEHQGPQALMDMLDTDSVVAKRKEALAKNADRIEQVKKELMATKILGVVADDETVKG